MVADSPSVWATKMKNWKINLLKNGKLVAEYDGRLDPDEKNRFELDTQLLYACPICNRILVAFGKVQDEKEAWNMTNDILDSTYSGHFANKKDIGIMIDRHVHDQVRILTGLTLESNVRLILDTFRNSGVGIIKFRPNKASEILNLIGDFLVLPKVGGKRPIRIGPIYGKGDDMIQWEASQYFDWEVFEPYLIEKGAWKGENPILWL